MAGHSSTTPVGSAALRAESLDTRALHILMVLARDRGHGAAIQREVRRLSDGRVELWPVALYGALEELEESGLIEEVDAPGRRRVYAITETGRAAVRREAERLSALSQQLLAQLEGVDR